MVGILRPERWGWGRAGNAGVGGSVGGRAGQQGDEKVPSHTFAGA
jgi:hypothetical protein